MQNISYDVIGTMLYQIWHGNPEAVPPIHVTTESGEFLTYLGINYLWEFIPEGKTLPAIVLILAFDVQRGGGPYFLYWTEASDLITQKQLDEWMAKLRERTPQKIVSMGIGNTL